MTAWPPGTLALRVGSLQYGGQALNHLGGFLEGRLRLFLRWHLAEVELIENPLPGFERLQFGKIRPERVEPEFALLFFRSVAFEAVRLEKGSVGFQFRIGLAQGCEAPKNQNPENLYFHNTLFSFALFFAKNLGRL